MPEPGLKVLPRRWVEERMFSCIDQNRRLSKDYERLPETSEAFIYLTMRQLMVRRLLAHEAFRSVSNTLLALQVSGLLPWDKSSPE